MNRRKLSLFLSVLLVASIFVPVFIHPAYASWYDPGWQCRKSITIDHTKVSADLTGFPVLISVTDSDLALKAQSNGYDILFTDSSGSIRLSHEIESYDSGDLVAWVNVPSLS